MTATTAPQHTAMGRLLDVIERAGNRVPHPVLMFLYLIIGVIVLSAVLAFAGVSVTEEIVVPDAVQTVPGYYEDTTQPNIAPGDLDYEDDFHVEQVTIPIKSLLDADGIRFLFTSFVPNFAGFGVMAVTFVALMGAGVAEASGLMGALIRLLVAASPRRILAFVLIFVGVLSSVATDAGYLILVPLGAAAFASVGRHPLAGMAACFAGVGAIFGVNPIPGPIDAQITAITGMPAFNYAIPGAGPTEHLAQFRYLQRIGLTPRLVVLGVDERGLFGFYERWEGRAVEGDKVTIPVLEAAGDLNGLHGLEKALGEAAELPDVETAAVVVVRQTEHARRGAVAVEQPAFGTHHDVAGAVLFQPERCLIGVGKDGCGRRCRCGR